MTDSVDELVKMSLNKPVRLFVGPQRTIASGLVQELVRVKLGKRMNALPTLLPSGNVHSKLAAKSLPINCESFLVS